MKPRRAIVFCHGARERTLDESGGLAALSELFDVIVDTSEFSKPWEFNFGYHDLYRGENVVLLRSLAAAETYFTAEAFDYILVVGLEWSKQREDLVRAVSQNCRHWGILFVRGDMIDLFRGRRYDTRWFIGWRQYLRRWLKKPAKDSRPATHYFSNELKAFEFPEVARKSTAIIPVSHSDYIKLQKVAAIDDNVGLVFIDQAVTFTFANSERNKAEERFYDSKRTQRYFDLLNSYLLSMQKSAGLGITICIHPNAPQDYALSFDPSFKIVRGKTLDYVAKAKLVVTHCSMATAFCHLLQVPTTVLAFPRAEMPKAFYKNTLRKARQEKLDLQRWPISAAPRTKISRASQKRIIGFLNPDASNSSLVEALKFHLRDDTVIPPQNDRLQQ